MDIVYIDEINYNDKEKVIEWCIDNIDENEHEEIDEKVVESNAKTPCKSKINGDTWLHQKKMIYVRV
jgi:uncharacterized protein YwqG